MKTLRRIFTVFENYKKYIENIFNCARSVVVASSGTTMGKAPQRWVVELFATKAGIEKSMKALPRTQMIVTTAVPAADEKDAHPHMHTPPMLMFQIKHLQY